MLSYAVLSILLPICVLSIAVHTPCKYSFIQKQFNFLNHNISLKGSLNRPPPIDVRIKDCPEAPCRIIQGTTADMQIDFRSQFSTTSIRPHVNATAFGVEVEYPLSPEFHDGCKHLIAGRCPLSKNQDVTYNFKFEVTKYYPAISVGVQVSLFDQQDNVLFCTRIAVVVVKA